MRFLTVGFVSCYFGSLTVSFTVTRIVLHVFHALKFNDKM